MEEPSPPSRQNYFWRRLAVLLVCGGIIVWLAVQFWSLPADERGKALVRMVVAAGPITGLMVAIALVGIFGSALERWFRRRRK